MPLLRIIACLLLVAATGCRPSADDPGPGEPGDTAFSLLSVGEPVPLYQVITPAGDSLSIGVGGPVTLLNLWATWCGPCREEFPDLEALHQELAPRGLRVLAVDVDADPPEAVLNFANEFDITFAVAIDRAGHIQSTYQAMGLPSSYLIGTDGRLLALWTGILPSTARATIEQHLTQL
jgi:thiol-disulfide isomerase/thioredoxin